MNEGAAFLSAVPSTLQCCSKHLGDGGGQPNRPNPPHHNYMAPLPPTSDPFTDQIEGDCTEPGSEPSARL
eukprot:CAMPEP_0179275456 /NCGR_PEP_ID=MMETSP0797-20121207/34071_1 /TAXON_ID=47934 /ORGANISM="Dinophysis acuminata, Strain DAEP01" /LENGTH=69 /DNA_ID=CAMNT_0020983981 /DNA_START=22 /DNA_END=231 /DNA_ORIENTATION=+